MVATDSQKNTYHKLLNAAVQSPKTGDFAALAAIITEIRAAGTPCGRISVPLRPERGVGEIFAMAYAKAQEAHPELPPVEWQGRKDPEGLTSRQARVAKWNASHEVVEAS